MFAVVDIAGFQEKVKEGETLKVPLLDAEEGKSVTFEHVFLVVKDGGEVSMGTPYVSGARVEAKVVGHGRDDKIRVFRMRRRRRFMRLKGHRQDHSMITITKVHA